MKILMNVFKVLTFLLCGIVLFFMLNLAYSNKEELKTEKNYTTGNATVKDRQAILNVLTFLQQGYSKRDLSKIDYYIDQTIDTTSIVVLGTNPNEIFSGKKGIQKLFYGDWKFWGDVRLNVEKAHITQVDNMAYIATTGSIKIDVWRITFPLRVTGVLIHKNSKWLINKLQFQYDLNTNFIIFGMIASVLATVSVIILMLILSISFVKKRIQ
jgi:hypothetical protein